MVWFTEWKWFDSFIMIIIIANSVMLCLQDYNERIYGPSYWSERNYQLEKIDLAFTVVFILECACKIVAKGFIFHKASYLRDPWNWLDFFVVVVSVLNFLPTVNSGGLKALRTFRILRPLRTINRLPKMKQIIETLFISLPGLLGVLIFLGFTFILFAIFGIQSFAGAQYRYCRTTAEPTLSYNSKGELTSYEWPVVSTFDWLCSTDKDCERFIGIFGPDPDGPTPPVFKCGATIELKPQIKAGGKMAIDNVTQREAILFDLVNFNNVGSAMLTIFQVLSLENWTDGMMYNYMDASNYYISALYFLTLVIFGAFFIMNLVLAQIIESYNDSQQKLKKANPDEEFTVKASNKFLGISFNNDFDINDRINSIQNSIAGQGEENNGENGDNGASSARQVLSKDFMENDIKAVFDAFKDPQAIDQDALIDETPDEESARKRSYDNFVFRFFFLLTTNWAFNLFITLMIILNTLSLAVDRYDQSILKEKVLAVCNLIFTWLFTAEMIFKIIGLGPKCYVKDYYNVFDAFVVILSVIDFVINQTLGENVGQAAGALKAFRALRLLRMIKLARRWKALQEILKKMLQSLEGIFYFGLLLLLFMYIFSLLGMQLFGNLSYQDLDGNSVLKDELVERYKTDILVPIRVSFDNIWQSMNTIYVIIMSDGWNWVMYQNVLPCGTKWVPYCLFFVVMQVLGNKVMLSLFTAILLQNFEGGDEEEEIQTHKAQPEKSLIRRIFAKETFVKVYADVRDIFGYRPTVREAQKLQQLEEEEKPSQIKNHGEQAAGPASGTDAAMHKIRIQPLESEVVELPPNIANQSQPEPSHISVHDQESEGHNSEDLRILQVEIQSEKKLASVQGKLNNSIRKSSSIVQNQRSAVHYLMLELPNTHTKQYEDETAEGNSLFCLSQTNQLRVFFLKFVNNKYFENIILLLIAVSTINLALESPLDDPNLKKLQVLQYIDYAMTAIFTIEMLSKIVAYGFLFNGPKSYLRMSWNILDFVIVLSSLFSLNPNTGKNLKVLKTLRILRVLRPLRMVARNKGLKISIMSLVQSLPDIVNLQLIIFFFLFLLGILHTTLFGGLFWNCNFDHLKANGSLTHYQTEVLIQTKWDCINYGGEWINADYNFDGIISSIVCLFSIQSTEGWNDPVMWAQVDSTDQDLQPKKWSKPYYILFSIFVNIITNLLFLNLFVGVVIESFNKQKEILIGLKNLTKRQLDWINFQIMGYSAKPLFKVTAKPEFSSIRRTVIQIVQHSIFDRFIMMCIVGNTVVLMVQWYGQSDAVNNVTNVINYVFMAIFTIECVLKLIALKRVYFKEAWNIFDFTVVVTTVVILVLGFFNIGNFAIQATILRSMRIGRLLRVMRFAKKLQIIFKTLTEAAPSMGSLGMLLVLVMFMYSIIGMKMFGFANVTEQSTVHYHCNFKNFFNAFLTLVRSATGEAWDSIMYDMGRPKSILFQCEQNQEYADLVANNMITNKCGNQVGSVLYFFTFIILVCQIFLNLFIAIIVDSFVAQTQASELPIESSDIETFVEIWSDFDNNANGQIPAHFIDKFVIKLQREQCKLLPEELTDQKEVAFFGIESIIFGTKRRKYIARLNCVIYNDWTQPDRKDIPSVTFIDLLQSMMREKIKSIHDSEKKQKEIRIQKMLALIESPKISQKDKKFLIDQIQKEEQEQNEEELDVDFEGFNGGLDYNSRKIDLLQDLRNMARKALGDIKKINELQSHPARQHKLDSDYEYYCKWHESHAARQAPEEPLAQPEDDLSIFAMPAHICGLMSKERFEKKVFNVEFTTFHYSYFNHIAETWKQAKSRRQGYNGLNTRMIEFGGTQQINPFDQPDQAPESARSNTKNNKVVPSLPLPAIQERRAEQERSREQRESAAQRK